MRYCPDCGRVNGCHPHCENAQDEVGPEWLLDFCDRFDAEEVEIFTHAYTAKVNKKRADKGLPPVQQSPLMRTGDYRKAITAFFQEEE